MMAVSKSDRSERTQDQSRYLANLAGCWSSNPSRAASIHCDEHRRGAGVAGDPSSQVFGQHLRSTMA
jgi:hypothetical protein